LTAGLFLACLAVAPAFAQDDPPQAEPDRAAGPSKPKGQGSDSVSSRLGRLEDKVNGLQVMVGTLESFIKAKPGTVLPQEAPPQVSQGPPSHDELGPRIDALEIKITALTSQIEQMGRQMSALEARLALSPPTSAPLSPSAEPPPERHGEALPPPADNGLAAAPGETPDESDTSKPRWYGPPPGSDQMAALIEEQAGPKPSESEPQSLSAARLEGDAQSLYQQGYGALLQKDYAGAERAFRQLLDSYPNDPLAGDAQYWVGETFYVRGQYKNAADAFLKGYKKYKSAQKAPDTLLKLGMSLAELGQKDAACSTLGELKSKYPAAPEHISDEAKAWRKKAGC
jgi:tol-pal system protein YbgF